MKTLKFAFVVLCIFTGPRAYSETVDLAPRLFLKYLSDVGFHKVQEKYLRNEGPRRVSRFLSHPALERSYTNGFRYELAVYVRDPKILNAIAYTNYKWTAETKEELGELIALYHWELYNALLELKDDPRLEVPQIVPGMGKFALGPKIGQMLASMDAKAGVPTDTLTPGIRGLARGLEAAQACISRIAGNDPLSRSTMIRSCLKQPALTVKPFMNYAPEQMFSKFDVREFIDWHPGLVVSKTGFLPGNNVRTLNRNRNTFDREYTQTLERFRRDYIKPYEQKWGALPEEEMISRMSAEIKKAEASGKNPIEAILGLPEEARSVDKNPIWAYYGEADFHPHQSFPNIVKAIREAESTVFIDVFFFGGTMGGSIAQLLLDETLKKPSLKVILVRDTVNHFGHAAEMAPVYNFLRAFGSLHPERRIVAAPSNIKRKLRNGFPDILHGTLDDSTLEAYGLDHKFSLYIKAQSDHSKVVIIDGDKPLGKPRLLVGSKNWTDSSGPVCNDEILWIEGPAAVVALDQYYGDLYEGMKVDWRENPYSALLYEALFAKGWAKTPECSQGLPEATSLSTKIERILCPFDLIGRFRNGGVPTLAGIHSLPSLKATLLGTQKVRLGENSVWASHVGALAQDIYAILAAKKQILINEQLLYSPQVVRALIEKAQAGVEIKAILEAFDEGGANAPNMPNLLYLERLNQAGVEIKWKLHAHSDEFAPEHHGKTLSIDGWKTVRSAASGEYSLERVDPALLPVLIAGSANKDLMTMRGAFRELQAEVFDPEASMIHDQLFWLNWLDPDQTATATFEKFEKSAFGQKLKEKKVPVPVFMDHARGFLETLYDAKEITR